jgi:hypothetical protein
MAKILLPKSYTEVADNLAKLIKGEVKREERTQQFGDVSVREIVLEGQVEFFALSLMDMWRGYVRFTIRDTAPTDEDREWRGEIAMWSPELAGLMTSPTQLEVERRQTVTIIVTTKRLAGTRVLDTTEERSEQEVWDDVTEEFHRLAMRESSFGSGFGE